MNNKTLSKELRFDIGGIIISVNSFDGVKFRIDDARTHFLTRASPDIMLNLRKSDNNSFQIVPEEKIFETKGLWSLYSNASNYILNFYSSDFGSTPYKIAVISKDFKSGDIYIDYKAQDLYFSNPLDYPFDELLMIHLLSSGKGVVAHSCGIKINNRGLLFVGSSGKGKSTIANIFKSVKGAVILNDDRVIIRKIGSRFWIYGTPWHGDARICSQEKAALGKVFFIRHAEDNIIKQLKSLEAASYLIASSFLPFWDKKGMEFALRFSSNLAKNIPSYDFGFVPDKSILEFIA